LIFDLDFATQSSYIFNVKNEDSVIIEVHMHVGQYNVFYISIIITDLYLVKRKKMKDFNFLDDLIFELGMKLSNLVGILTKNQIIEFFIRVNYNYIKINFAPMLLHGDEFENLPDSIKHYVIDRI
jgi:hypothetical protein